MDSDNNLKKDFRVLDNFVKIHSCSTIDELLLLRKELSDSKAPVIFLNLGIAFLHKEDKENAKESFLSGIKLGSSFPNEFFDDIEIDSIGQCFAMLLIHYVIEKINYDNFINNAIKITALAYIYLSRCIELIPKKAYDSYRTRALLFKDHNYYVIVNKLFSQNFEYPILLEPFILSDFYMCSSLEGTEHNDDIKYAKEALDDLYDLSDVVGKINDKNLEEFSLQEMVNYGRQRHHVFYNILKSRYEEGAFNISFNEISATFNS